MATACSTDLRDDINDNLFQLSLKFAAGELRFLREFKPQQRHAIRSVLQGRDVFVNLPTGFGKSLIYQTVPLCWKFIRQYASPTTETLTTASVVSVVISPLISLMQDQTRALNAIGIRAVYMGEISDQDQMELVLQGGLSTVPMVVYMSPENALGSGRSWIQSCKGICGLFVDESHCIGKW